MNDVMNKNTVSRTLKPPRPYCKVTSSGALKLLLWIIFIQNNFKMVLYADQWNNII